MLSKFIWWKINRQGHRKHIFLQFYKLNDFLCYKFYLLSLFFLVCSVHSLETIIAKSFFQFLVFNINSYTFVLYLSVKKEHINFWSFSYHFYVVKYLRQRMKTEIKNHQLTFFCFHILNFRQHPLFCTINVHFIF